MSDVLTTEAYKAKIDARDNEHITEIFLSSWGVYREVVDGNHLNHAATKEHYIEELSSIISFDEGLTVLDLGCGDCILPSEVLTAPGMSSSMGYHLIKPLYVIVQAIKSDSCAGVPKVIEFTGVDFAAAPLHVAEAAASFPAGCKSKFIEADMMKFVKESTETYHVIMCSYVVHHLETLPEKEAMLKDIYNRLKPGGLFLWADIYNHVPGRSRSDTMDVWKKRVLDGFTGLSDEDRKTVWEHIFNYDYPEDLPTEKTMLINAGFDENTVKCVYTDEFFCRVWVAHKQ